MVSTNTQIRKYEIVFISNPEITDQEIEELVKIVSKEINDLSGTIIKTDIWGLKKLSYPIKKFREGNYVLIEFDILPSSISKLNKTVESNETIIRSLITKIS
ncbi:MAG: 30S ribosomal protein S6 [SAR202 cluster bacterium]|nr:30S ribosomal protein S6 [SAR202 cluster bacterium]